MSPSRVRMVTSRPAHIDRKKKRTRKKVLDKLVENEYNESIKSEEWFLAHSSIRRKHDDN